MNQARRHEDSHCRPMMRIEGGHPGVSITVSLPCDAEPGNTPTKSQMARSGTIWLS